MPQSKKLKCKYCTFSTTDRGAMAQHLRTYHASMVPKKFHSDPNFYNDYSFIDNMIESESTEAGPIDNE